MKPSMNVPISSLAARESAGGASPGRYFPVRTPWASGDQTIWEIPFSSQSGITSSSGSRQSMRVLRLAGDELLHPGQLQRLADLLRRSTR